MRRAEPKVSQVAFIAANASDRATGLIGYVEFMIDGWLRVAGVTVRRTRTGDVMLSYPSRRDRHGDMHPYLRPVDPRSRLEIERQVLAALAMETTP